MKIKGEPLSKEIEERISIISKRLKQYDVLCNSRILIEDNIHEIKSILPKTELKSQSIKDDEDPVLQFCKGYPWPRRMDEDGGWVRGVDIYHEYKQWCTINNYTAVPNNRFKSRAGGSIETKRKTDGIWYRQSQ